jgi:hypothetical protein
MTDIRLRSHDRIPAIDDPKFVTAEEGDVYLRPGDYVIGVKVGGEARAYPVEFLNGREVVNDSLGGGPITVTW